MDEEEEEGEYLILPTITTKLSTREFGAKLWEILPQSTYMKTEPRVSYSSSMNTPSFSSPASSTKTSMEFLKMLNRIWSMEEQHLSNLRTELDQSRARVKELTRNKQKTEEIEEESEMMYERKFRKLEQEVSDLRISLSNALKFLDKEKEDRILLEEICYEFAKGIREYQNGLQSVNRRESCCHDKLILHLSEAWIDERLQMKQQVMESKKKTIVEKLKSEIENFLQSKRDSCLLKCRHSLASSSSVKEAMMESSLREKLQEARLEEGRYAV